MSFEGEQLERLHKTVLLHLNSDPIESLSSSIAEVVKDKLTLLANPNSIFTRSGSLSSQQIISYMSMDEASKEKFGCLLVEEAVFSIAETSAVVPIELEELIPLYLKALRIGYDPSLVTEEDSGLSAPQRAKKLTIDMFKRELYCLVLTVKAIVNCSHLEGFVTSTLSELPKNYLSFANHMIREISSSTLEVGVSVYVLETVIGTLLTFFSQNRTPPTVDVFDCLVGLVPQALGGTTSLRYPCGVTVSDIDFALGDGGAVSKRLATLIAFTVCGAVRRGGTSGLMALPSFTERIKQENHWSEQSEIGRFLGFFITGVMLEDAKFYRNGLVYWNSLDFLRSIVDGDLQPGQVEICEDLTAQLLLPLHRWSVLKKLDLFAYRHGLIASEALQSAAIKLVVSLMKKRGTLAEKWKDILIDRLESFHNTPPVGVHGNVDTFDSIVPPLGDGFGTGGALLHDHHSDAYITALEMCTCFLSRAPLSISMTIGRKLAVHHNHWFNLGRIMERLIKASKRESSLCDDKRSPSYLPALIELVSAAFSCRLSLSHQFPGTDAIPAAIRGSFWAGSALLDLVISLTIPAVVKSSALNGLASMTFSPESALNVLSAVSPSVGGLLAFQDDQVTRGTLSLLLVLLTYSGAREDDSFDFESITDSIVREALLTSKDAIIRKLALKWLRCMLLSSSASKFVSSYAYRALLSSNSPVWAVLVEACKDKLTSGVCFDIVRILLQRGPTERVVRLLVGSHESVLMSVLTIGLTMEDTIKPALFILLQVVFIAAEDLNAMLQLYPFLARSVSVAIGSVLTGALEGLRPVRKQSTFVGTPSTLPALGDGIETGMDQKYLAEVDDCGSKFTQYHLCEQAELLFLQKLAERCMNSDLLSGKLNDPVKRYYIGEESLVSFHREECMDHFSLVSARRLALLCLKACHGDVGATLLGLIRKIDGWAPDQLTEGGAVECVFLLLDNPPSQEHYDSIAWEEYRICLCICLKLLENVETHAVAMRFIEYSWINRYRIVREVASFSVGQTDDSRAMRILTLLLNCCRTEMLIVGKAVSTDDKRFIEDVSNMKSVASAFLTDSRGILLEEIFLAVVSKRTVDLFTSKGGDPFAGMTCLVDPLLDKKFTVLESDRHNQSIIEREARLELGKAVSGFTTAACRFLFDDGMWLRSWLEGCTEWKREDSLGSKIHARMVSDVVSEICSMDGEGMDGFSVRESIKLLKFLSKIDKEDAERLLKSVCCLFAWSNVFTSQSLGILINCKSEFHAFLRFLCEFSKSSQLVSSTLAALVSVSFDGPTVQVLLDNWNDISGSQPNLLEALVRNQRIAARAFEAGLIVPGCPLNVMLSATLALPNNEAVLEIAQWTFRSNKETLKALLKSVNTTSESKVKPTKQQALALRM